MKKVIDEYEEEILSEIRSWVGLDVSEPQAHAVLWALMMMDKDYTLLEYLKRERAEYRRERRQHI